jgi:hypothetical protein
MGLDAIAITDHVEYQPHKVDLTTDHHRSFELASAYGKALYIVVIQGAEICRKLPPGHFNALFVTDANALETKDYRDSIKKAVDQGAFVFWNHPSYEHPEGKTEWFPEHTELLEKGWLHGIEVVNGRTYYPEVQRWCIEKNLTMLCNSDVHEPIAMYSEGTSGEHRPVTLIFAKDRTADALKEALFARRAVAYVQSQLLGDEKYLKPIFDASVTFVKRSATIQRTGRVLLQIRNSSCVDFELSLSGGAPAELEFPKSITLRREKTVLYEVRSKRLEPGEARKIVVPYVVKNLLIGPDKGLPVTLEFELSVVK